MKKLSIILLSFLLILTGCSKPVENTKGKEANKEKETIKIAALKGPTAMGLVKLFNDSDEGKTEVKYEYKILNSPDEAVTGLMKGEYDVCSLPSNLAAIINNKKEDFIKVAAINTLGVLYIASTNDDVKTIADLKGKTLVTSGQGASPEFVLRHLLIENGLDPDKDVNIQYKNEHSEVVSDIVQNKDHIVMLPQPFLTVAQKKVEGLKELINLTEEWDKLKDSGKLIVGVTVVRNDFLKDHEEAFKTFLKEYKESVDFTKNDEAAKLVGKYEIVPEEVAKEALPKCNITFIDGQKMEDDLANYLKVLYDQEKKSVGGKLPGENFYYK